jgi:CRP-like cAMP-binding protein
VLKSFQDSERQVQHKPDSSHGSILVILLMAMSYLPTIRKLNQQFRELASDLDFCEPYDHRKEVFKQMKATGLARTIKKFQTKDTIFAQGDVCRDVMYIEKGYVKLSVVSKFGKEAVVAILKPGDFVGEGALAGQRMRIATAAAITPATLVMIELGEMMRVLHTECVFSDYFIKSMVRRNIRTEADLTDQLFNSSEKRLARTLLLLARSGNWEEPNFVMPKISQETLAEMIGTTRPRVNFFMKKFEKLGFIHQNGGLRINDSLFNVVLND